MSRRKTKTDLQGIIVQGYPLFLVIGAIDFVFGCAITFLCLKDSAEGNPTASPALALVFFLCFAVTGLGLMGYSRRRIQLVDGQLLIRDFLSRTHSYQVDEIREVVSGRLLICTAMGSDGVLFRLYDYSPLNPGYTALFQELERRGVRVDVGARVFGTVHFSALHPDPGRRNFHVLLTYFPGRLGSRLTVQGRCLTVRRPFRRETSLDAGQISEARLTQKGSGNLHLQLYARDGRRFLKLSRSPNLANDLSITALLIQLSDCGVPLRGLEHLKEDIRLSLRCRYAAAGAAAALFSEEYARHVPLFRQCEAQLAKAGFQLLYGPADRNQNGGPSQNSQPLIQWDSDCECGIFFCLLKEGRLVYTQREQASLSALFPVVLRPPAWVEKTVPEFHRDIQEEPALVFFQPLSDDAIKHWLDLFGKMAVKGKTLVNADEAPVTTPPDSSQN